MSEEEKWIVESLRELLNKAQEFNHEKIAMNTKTARIILNIIDKSNEKMKELNSIIDELNGIKENEDGTIDVYID